VDPTGLMLSDIGVYQTDNPGVAMRLENALVTVLRRYMEGQTGAAQRQQRYQRFNSSFGRGRAPSLMSGSGSESGAVNTEQSGTGTTQQQNSSQATLKAQFPGFTGTDLDTVGRAIRDAYVAVSTVPTDGGMNMFNSIIIMSFRGTSKGTPGELLEALDYSSGNLTKQNVYDGRVSTLTVTDQDSNGVPNGNQTTVAQYFKNHSSVGAITLFNGIIFLGPNFFDQYDDARRAQAITHEGVVHVGYTRNDKDFGKTGTEGSYRINRIIENGWNARPR
jgi:hypothetical protein